MTKSNAKKPKQPTAFLEAHGTWLTREKAETEDSFLQLFSEANMEGHLRMKPLGKVRMRFMDDHIEFRSVGIFGSRPPRTELSYRDIARYVTMETQATVLHLGVRDHGQSMICEVIRFQEPDELNRAVDLIVAARAHRDYRLLNAEDTVNEQLASLNRHTLAPPHNGEMEEINRYAPQSMNHSQSHLSDEGVGRDFSTSDQVPTRPRLRVISDRNASFNMPVTEECQLRNNHNMQTIRNWRPEDLQACKAQLMESIDPNTWTVDVKTVESHPIYGSRISDNGSVFMFIAHMIPESQQLYTACSSSNASLNSSGPETSPERVDAPPSTAYIS